MRERELSELEIGAAFQAFLEDAPTDVQPAVLVDQLVRVHQADQQTRRWWSVFVSRPSWSPALRVAWLLALVVVLLAATVAAIFVGSELLRRPDDLSVVVPVPESPPPAPTEGPLPSVRTDILPGVPLTVEEVEPGVLWVVEDGRGSDHAYPFAYPVAGGPYDIVAGHDGGIYVLEPGGYKRLGGWGRSPHDSGGFGWSIVDGFPSDIGVTPDGTIWAAFDGRIYSTPWASGHLTRHLTTTGQGLLEVTSDGTVWAVWLDDSGSAVFGYHEADGWTMVGEWPFDGYLIVSDGGEIWAVHHVGWGFGAVHRFVDGAWREEEGGGLNSSGGVGVDGTLWGISGAGLVHFDGTEWTAFEPPDWVPEVGAWTLTEDGWVDGEEVTQTATSITIAPSWWGEPHLAPDGSLWVQHQLGVLDHAPDLGDGRRVVCDHGIDGVVRFDGETWSRFLQGRCVEAMDIAADGSVWTLASKSDARYPLAHLYVITPEAVAASD